MRAVNLIPAEERRGGGGSAGRSGGGVYVLLGALAAFVVLAGLWVAAGRQVDDRARQLAEVRTKADAAQATADKLAAYSRFATVAQSRLETVRNVAASRFDWSHTLREVGRVIPEDVALESLDGSVAPPAAPAGDPAAAAATPSGPTLKIIGCTPSEQRAVARLMARLRQIDGVKNVALESSAKEEAGAAAGGLTSAGGGKGCANGKGTGAPKFTVAVTFGSVPVAPQAAAPAAPAAAASAPAAASTATPTGSTTP
ncbi:MAG TPA: hypothetical protein VD931_20670 [Baekduia sp.]|nr:hypothetical protein [Baekduia sp.]